MQIYNCIMVFHPVQDKMLLCLRTTPPYLGKYNLVGGKAEPGEDGFAAAYRELYEETGIAEELISLSHMMDFTYYNQNCRVEVYAGTLSQDIPLRQEKHPLCWMSLTEDFFDLERFAGEGNIGHMLEQIRDYGPGTVQNTI